jgi:hypothetical protein
MADPQPQPAPLAGPPRASNQEIARAVSALLAAHQIHHHAFGFVGLDGDIITFQAGGFPASCAIIGMLQMQAQERYLALRQQPPVDAGVAPAQPGGAP